MRAAQVLAVLLTVISAFFPASFGQAAAEKKHASVVPGSPGAKSKKTIDAPGSSQVESTQATSGVMVVGHDNRPLTEKEKKIIRDAKLKLKQAETQAKPSETFKRKMQSSM